MYVSAEWLKNHARRTEGAIKPPVFNWTAWIQATKADDRKETH